MPTKEEKLKRIACEAIDSQIPELRTLSRDIWSHPELNFEETYAHQRLSDFLEERGFEVERSFKVDTAFRARPKGAVTQKGVAGCPNVAVLCEYDALPGIGHACGHNLIATVGVAAALGIKAALCSDEFSGNGMLTVMGTPAEEGGGGKIDLINAGAFDDVDVAMMAHPYRLNVQSPSSLSIAQLSVKYHGKAAHAASSPWGGVNALDAAVQCYTNISHLRQQMKPSWRVHGIITDGGVKPNIIPSESEMLYYLRAPTDPELDLLKGKVIGCIEGAATATGCKVEHKFVGHLFSSLLNNAPLASVYEENGQGLGIQQDPDPENRNLGGSTDMGNVSHVVPSIHPMFDIGGDLGPHTPEFAAQANTEEAEDYSLAVAKALAMTALDLYLKHDLLSKAKETFTQELEKEKNAV